MKFFERNRQQLAERGVDPDRLPPGQYVTDRFPVLHAGRVPEYRDLGTWDLALSGLVARPRSLSWAELSALPTVDVTVDIHCVTKWSKLDTVWEGISVDTLIADAATRGVATAPFLVAFSDGGYTTNMPLDDVIGGKAWVAFGYDGKPLHPEHGGPARLLVPHLYFWKSAKWVSRLTLMDHDEPGFWERNGYHDRGDPWTEQRYQGD